MRHARKLLIGGAIALGLGISAPRRAAAQCTGNASSCVTCHEVQGLRPVLGDAHPWHADHASGDLCAACHGGQASESDQAAAHAGLVHPLADPRATCGACHDDAAARADRYLAVGTSTVAGASSGGAGGAGAGSGGDGAGDAPGAARARAPAAAASIDRVLGVTALVLAAALALVARGRRPRVIAALRAKAWSPYAAGAGLGVVLAISMAGFGKTVAVAGAFDRLAAYVGHAVAPSSVYWSHLVPPAITWHVWMVLGLLGGAFASAWASREARVRTLPDAQWVERFGARRWRRALVAFAGAVLVQIGAAIAGGCTSGLAMSGGAALAPAAFLFMAGMFGGGIPTAWLIYRGRRP